MKKFLLLLHDKIEILENISPNEMDRLIQAYYAWSAKLEEEGHMLSGEGLQETGIKIIGRNCNLQEGPYIKSNDMIGGYYLLQAKDLDTVIEITKECPCHLWGGTTEIRPIMEY